MQQSANHIEGKHISEGPGVIKNLPVFKNLNKFNKAGAKQVSRGMKRDDTTGELGRDQMKREQAKLRSLEFIY